MRRLAFLLAIASLAGMLLAQLSWGKQKCHTGCVTVNPAPPGCQVQCEWDSWSAECFHPVFFVQHTLVSRTGDIYEWQCVPCDVPEGTLSPQYMQWWELREYSCGVKCAAFFVTKKGRGPQEPVEVPCAIVVNGGGEL